MHRRDRQPATSLAWGYWQDTGMTAHLSAAEQARLTRGGLVPITTEHGLALFDTALIQQQPYLVASPFNAAALARQARRHTLPAILSGLTRARPQAATAAGPDTLAARLAGQTPEQQLRTLTTLVATATATVLAHPDPAALDTDRPFKDLGIDSLTALELRNTLTAQTGLTLPATLVFDHPTPPRWPATWPACSAGAPTPVIADHASARRGSRSRWRWWGWRAGSPGGWIRRRGCGIWSAPGVDAMGEFPGRSGLESGGVV